MGHIIWLILHTSLSIVPTLRQHSCTISESWQKAKYKSCTALLHSLLIWSQISTDHISHYFLNWFTKNFASCCDLSQCCRIIESDFHHSDWFVIILHRSTPSWSLQRTVYTVCVRTVAKCNLWQSHCQSVSDNFDIILWVFSFLKNDFTYNYVIYYTAQTGFVRFEFVALSWSDIDYEIEERSKTISFIVIWYWICAQICTSLNLIILTLI